MRRIIAVMVALTLAWGEAVAAPRNSWNKIRYRGGTVKVRVDPWDWNTALTVTPDFIVLVFSPRTTVRIKPSQVRSISYGEEAHRRRDIVALGVWWDLSHCSACCTSARINWSVSSMIRRTENRERCCLEDSVRVGDS